MTKLTFVISGNLEQPAATEIDKFVKFMKDAVGMNLLSFGVVDPDTVHGLSLKVEFEK